jgi:hypothetical protein
MRFEIGDRVTIIDNKTIWQGMEGTVTAIPSFPGIYYVALDGKDRAIDFHEFEIVKAWPKEYLDQLEEMGTALGKILTST